MVYSMGMQQLELAVRVCPKGHEISGDNAKPYMKYGKQQTTCRTCAIERTKEARGRNGDWLPADTESVMASYKEPLKPVYQGFGYYGTIAYDKAQQYTQCHLCGNFYKTLGTHVSKVHGKSAQQYKLEMGLPAALSLTPPKARNKNYEQWMALTPEERKKAIERMVAARDKRVMPAQIRSKSLYQKNLEGRCPDQLLDKILVLKEKLGRVPSRREFAKEYKGKFVGSIDLTFGGWGEAIKILGLTPRKGGSPLQVKYDKETLLTMLFEFKNQYGREPMSTDAERGLLPSRGTFRNHFGSWTDAKKYVIDKV